MSVLWEPWLATKRHNHLEKVLVFPKSLDWDTFGHKYNPRSPITLDCEVSRRAYVTSLTNPLHSSLIPPNFKMKVTLLTYMPYICPFPDLVKWCWSLSHLNLKMIYFHSLPSTFFSDLGKFPTFIFLSISHWKKTYDIHNGKQKLLNEIVSWWAIAPLPFSYF